MTAPQLLRKIAADWGLTYEQVRSENREPYFVRVRIEIAERLRWHGCTVSRIGRLLNRDHSTINYYLGMRKVRPSSTVWGASPPPNNKGGAKEHMPAPVILEPDAAIKALPTFVSKRNTKGHFQSDKKPKAKKKRGLIPYAGRPKHQNPEWG